MTEQEALAKMIAPGTHRRGKYLEGVIQIHITRACDLACYNCTQGSQLGGKNTFMSPEHFEQAVLSLKGYFGVYGVFGGNPALSPHFDEYCRILKKNVPFNQRGLWCNHPKGHGKIMRETFDPSHSNLNVHLSQAAYDEFKRDWPESNPVGLHTDSRHSPCYVAMKDVLKKTCPGCNGTGKHTSDAKDYSKGGNPVVGKLTLSCIHCDGVGKVYDESKAWELISDCDINKHWSAMIGIFRGELRAWFCEIAGAQAMLHQHEEDYPDTGLKPTGAYAFDGQHNLVQLGTYDENRATGIIKRWWELPMNGFKDQVRKHCHECSVPLRGHGELAQSKNVYSQEQVSKTHEGIYKLKSQGRRTEVVTELVQLGNRLGRMTDYLGNSRR